MPILLKENFIGGWSDKIMKNYAIIAVVMQFG